MSEKKSDVIKEKTTISLYIQQYGYNNNNNKKHRIIISRYIWGYGNIL